MNYECIECGGEVAPGRWALKRYTCLPCGEKQSKLERRSWCIAPISNKAAYTLITDITLLKQINPKRTTT